jgi:anti-anti-sigma regulatory factor
MNAPLESLTREGWSVEPKLVDRRLSLRMTGTFDMTAASALQAYFAQVLAHTKAFKLNEIAFDVSEVYYLGSSSIKAFVTLVAALRSGLGGLLIRVITNPRLDWQERTFSVLARLAPDMVSIERPS